MIPPSIAGFGVLKPFLANFEVLWETFEEIVRARSVLSARKVPLPLAAMVHYDRSECFGT